MGLACLRLVLLCLSVCMYVWWGKEGRGGWRSSRRYGRLAKAFNSSLDTHIQWDSQSLSDVLLVIIYHFQSTINISSLTIFYFIFVLTKLPGWTRWACTLYLIKWLMAYKGEIKTAMVIKYFHPEKIFGAAQYLKELGFYWTILQIMIFSQCRQ